MSKKTVMTMAYMGDLKFTYHEFYDDGTYITQHCPEVANQTLDGEWRLTENQQLEFRYNEQRWVAVTQLKDKRVEEKLIAAIVENNLLLEEQ